MAKKAKRGKTGKGKKRASARRPARKSVKRTVSKRVNPRRHLSSGPRRRSVLGAKPARKAAAKKAAPASLGSTPLKGQANMLVTFDPNHRGTAELELREVLRQAGEKAQIGQTEVEGLFKVAVSDARKAAARIKGLCRGNSGLFTVTHHYTPIDKWCAAEVGEMQKAIRAVSAGIGQNEKWKMGLNKRHWDKLEGGQLIVKLTDVVERKNVDLDNPDKIVQVEIIGKEAGIALLTPKDIVDVAREKGG